MSRQAPSLEIFLIPDAYDKKYLKGKKKRKQAKGRKNTGKDLMICIASLAGSTIAAFALNRIFGFSAANIVMVYMLSVLTCAIFASRQIWGAIASVLSILVFNFSLQSRFGRFKSMIRGT